MSTKISKKKTKSIKQKLLPTNLRKCDAAIIHFNKITLQQIKNNGNLTYAIQILKGGVGFYFDYLVDDVLPKLYNPNDYKIFSSRNLNGKINNFKKFAITKD